ncbi:MAG TPA: tetratricopeptide repeat protein [Methylomirabilota bacterium]|nr:tetratricopeptide repeat protein [Methylomirabilota bacterium]
MRWLVYLLLCAAPWKTSAQDIDSRLREVVSVSRTNVPAALTLYERIARDFPTNSQPLVLRARLLDRSRRYEDALRDLSAALKLDPKTPQLWQARGEVNFKAGYFKESVADFDRVLERSPGQAPHHWQRGISLYYAGRFADGRKQFDLHRAVNPNDVENAVWHFLCAAREQGITNARASMLPVGPDSRVPMAEIDSLYRGTGSVEKVISAATRPTSDPRQREAIFYAHLYLGLFFDVSGEAAKAREHISKAATDLSAEHYMGDVARVHFRKLNATQ